MAERPRIYAAVAAHTDAIEAELRRMGWWDGPEPTAEQMRFERAFALDTMAFAQWVRWILVPRIRDIIATRDDFPETSMVGTQAAREFDGQHEAQTLSSLLSQLDALIEGR